MRNWVAFALALLAVTVAPTAAQSPAPAASAAIPAAYAQLAQAYENADEATLRALIAPDFAYAFVPGTNENLAQYIADWKTSKQYSPGLSVAIRVTRLTIHEATANAQIVLTQTNLPATQPLIEAQRENDRWALRNGTWILVAAQIVSDTVSFDGKVVSNDGPANLLTVSQRAAVVAQLKELAWTIDTATPGGSSRELEPLGDAIGQARIVGLGEATHGGSEFFSLKDRIFRFLVEKLAFTVFAMEASWDNSLALERYVTTGTGDVRVALSSTFAVWDNQEVLDLIEWMRAYNVTRGNRPELHFVGIDMQDNPIGLREIILRFVKATRPADLDQTAQRLACVKLGAPASEHCVAGVAAVDMMVATAAKTATLPRDQVLQAEHAADIALQMAQMFNNRDTFDQVNLRDRFMARNVQWFATTMFPHSRIALWAHDGHVMTSSTGGMIPMGTYLRRRYGTNYYVIGFAFDRGSTLPNGVSAPVTVPPDPPEAVGGVLRSAGEPLFGLNLRPISTRTPLGAYLSSEQPMRTLGAFASLADIDPSQSYGYINLKKSFDTLIFVDTMHPAHGFDVAPAAAWRQFTVPAGAGGIAWQARWWLVGSDPANYKAGGDAPSATNPAGLLWLWSVAGKGTGVTSVVVSVAPYRGKRIQVSGDLRTYNANGGAAAWLRVDGANGRFVKFDTMNDRMLEGTTEWTPFTITLDVPQNARDAAFGLWLHGPGWLWATNLRMKSVDSAR
jgi:erythromycin esterase